MKTRGLSCIGGLLGSHLRCVRSPFFSLINRSARLGLHAMFLSLLIHDTLNPAFAGTVVWTGAGDGTNWNQAANWTGNVVPGPADNAVIDVPASTPSIFISGGTISLRSLQNREGLVLAGGSLVVTGGVSSVEGPVFLAPGSTVAARGATTTLTLSGAVAADGARFTVSAGASVEVMGLSSYADTAGCCGAIWDVADAGSVLRLTSLTNIVGNPVPSWPASLRARSGGHIELPALRSLSGGASEFLADGNASQINLPVLTTTTNALAVLLEGRAGGSIVAPAITDGSRITVVRRGGGVVPAAQFSILQGATADNAVLDLSHVHTLTSQGVVELLNGGTLDLSSVTNVDGVRFRSAGGTTLSIPGLARYKDTAGCCGTSFEANGKASRIVLPALVSVDGNPVTSWQTEFRAFAGGRVEAPVCTGFTSGSASLLADGAGSVVDFSALSNVVAADLIIEARNAGSVIVPSLVDGSRVGLTVRGTSFVSTGQWTRLRDITSDASQLSLNQVSLLTPRGRISLLRGGSLGLPAVTNVDGISFNLSGASTLSLPAITSFKDAGGCCGPSWVASGVGSILDLPGLKSIDASPSFTLSIQALSGGTVLLNSVDRLEPGHVEITVDGSGSLVRLPSLKEISSETRDYDLLVQNGGHLEIPGVRRIQGVTVRQFSGGRMDLLQMTNVSGSSFIAGAGEQIVLPAITAYEDTPVCCGSVFRATGTGALIRFPSLSFLSGNPSASWSLDVSALSGGTVDLQSVLSLGAANYSLLAEGTNSLVDLRRVDAFDAGAGSLYAEARVGGVVRLDALTRLNRGGLVIRNSGFIPTAQLTRLLNATVTMDAHSAPFGSLLDMRGTTFNYPNGGSATFPPETDLVPLTVGALAAANSGQPLQVVWTVKNQGVAPVTGPRKDSLYLSTDASVGNDLLLGHFSVPEGLAVGASQNVTNTVILPSGISGNRWLVVQADSAFDFFEGTNEPNNTLVAAQPIAVSVADLSVDQLVAPASATFGTPLSVSWRVRNTGSTAAPSPWTDALYLSTNNAVSPGAILLGNFPAGQLPLAAGAAYTVTQSVVLPISASLASGSYFLVVKADAPNFQAESDENNNLRSSGALAVVRPPLPDLAISFITTPPSVVPGALFPVSYGVTNRGAAALNAAWEESVQASADALIGADSPLGYRRVTNAIPAGGSLIRTQWVALPAEGLAGALRLVVLLDTAGEVVESDESNNALLSAVPTQVPLLLGLTPGTVDISEDAGPSAAQLRVSRNGSLAAPLTVTLAASEPGRVQPPAQITLPANVSSLAVSLGVTKDGIADGNHEVRLTASAPGFAAVTNLVRVRDTDIPALLLSMPASTLIEGESLSASVTRKGVLSQPLTVTIGNPSPGQLSAPPSVIIPAGQSTVSFPVLALDDIYVESPRTYSMEVTALGYTGSAAPLQVLDNDMPAFQLELSSPRIQEGSVPGAVTLKVTRTQDGVLPLGVRLIVSRPDELEAVRDFSFAPGEVSVLIPLSAVDDDRVDGDTLVTLTVQPVETLTLTAVPPGASTTVTVVDNDGPSIRLEVSRTWLCASDASFNTLKGTLHRNGNTNVAATVTVSAEPAGILLPVSPVQFGVNQDSAPVEFRLAGVPSEDREVLIRAIAPGYSEGAMTLRAAAVCAPDLVVTQVTGPATGLTGDLFSLSYRDQNVGSPFAVVAQQPGVTRVAQNVYLSSDRHPGDDLFLGAVVFDGSVNPYTSLDRTVSFFLPHEPGDYWVIVEADAGGDVAEIDEDNNFSVSSLPIHVDPSYTASVVANPRSALAGTPVVLSGKALKAGSGQPVPFELISLHITLRDTERVIAALTDAQGNYSAVFTPLPGEAGSYRVGAAHPGVAHPPSQETFVLVGMRASPATLEPVLTGLETQAATVELENLGDVALTGLITTVVGAPAGVNVQAVPPASLAPFGHGTLSLGFSLTQETDTTAEFSVRVSSTQGAVADVFVSLTGRSKRPSLVVSPAVLEAGAVRGGQQFVQFSIANLGGGASDPVQIILPEVPFLHVATPMPAPGLAPGATNVITLQLLPTADTALGQVTGNLIVAAGEARLSVPFSFSVLSTNVGSLLVEVTDQFTYYAEGAPRVSDARVELRDPSSGTTLQSLTTGADGLALFPSIPEGYYALHVSAEGHAPYRRNVLVGAGVQTHQEALMNRTVVQFIWNVTPTEIEDRTHITIESVFETVVPLPVVTVEPSVIDLSNYPNGGVINLSITNHGLIAAQDTQLTFSDFDCWRLTPLISDIGTLPARSAVVIPVRICRDLTCSRSFGSCAADGPTSGLALASPAEREAVVSHVMAGVLPAGGGGGGGCGGGGVVYFVPCGGGKVGGGAPIGISNSGGGRCGHAPTGQPGGGPMASPSGGGGGGGGGGCDPCSVEVGVALAKCLFNFVYPLGLGSAQNCVIDFSKCVHGFVTSGATVGNMLNCLGAMFSCLEAAGKKIPGLGQLLTLLGCEDDLLSTCGGSGLGGFLGLPGGGGHPVPPLRLAGLSGHPYPGMAEVETSGKHIIAFLNSYVSYFGSVDWVSATSDTNYPGWMGAFQTASQAGSDSGELISAAELTSLAIHPLTRSLKPEAVTNFVQRWNRSINYYRAGVFESTQVPAGQSLDFLAVDLLRTSFNAASNAVAEAQAAGYETLFDEAQASIARLRSIVNQPQDGTCAKVRLSLDQDAVIARDAFRADLQIINSSGSPMTGVTVDLKIYRPDGTIATPLFAIPAPALSGLTGVEGNGTVVAGTTGTATWNILPTIDAAPENPQSYQVGGSIRYTQDGASVTVPLALVTITVHPLAQLHLDYFHQRDVLADDPFTAEVEPSVPYSLAVLVRNTGKGTARHLKITSAQPKIIDNEKGLLVDFQVIATQVGNRNLVPSLTADFGDVAAGGVALGQWLLKSSLQGLFIEYSASFQHTDNLGDPRLSLIQGVEIHELIRMVHATGAFEDGQPDMLVNDIPDFEDLPDTLHLSDGRIMPVGIVQEGTVNGVISAANLTVGLQCSQPAGWSYLRILEPAGGRFKLARVVRADGTEVPFGTNVWTSDRTFVGAGHRPVKENRLHLLDYNGPGNYTLTYAPAAPSDVTAPTSRVLSLPTVSEEKIPVAWSGEDNAGGVGVAYYDIFVSLNNGPFAPWIQHTTDKGAVYTGVRGNSYAFYSLATDVAGNREPGPLAPDAVTAVGITNTAPQLQAAVLTVAEGEVLRYTNVVSDPDVPPQSLFFSLVGDVPPGLTLNPQTGAITWPTTESNGPATNHITVRVSDNGFPALYGTNVLTVVVQEVNRAPELATIADRVVRVGRLLSVTNVASDPDLPGNRLRFSLEPGAPAGVLVDADSGLLTWRPTSAAAGKTHSIGVVVSDGGQPPLTATRRFNVTVRDPSGDLQLSLGSTYLSAGKSGSVPLTIRSALELRRLQFQVVATPAAIENLSMPAVSAELSSVSIVPSGVGRALVTLDFDPNQLRTGTRTLANLKFDTVAGNPSALVRILMSDLSGQTLDGLPVAGVALSGGRVFVIGREPLLDVGLTPGGDVFLTVYGRAGTNYVLESTEDIVHPNWQEEEGWLQTDAVRVLNSTDFMGDMLFWRVRER